MIVKWYGVDLVNKGTKCSINKWVIHEKLLIELKQWFVPLPSFYLFIYNKSRAWEVCDGLFVCRMYYISPIAQACVCTMPFSIYDLRRVLEVVTNC